MTYNGKEKKLTQELEIKIPEIEPKSNYDLEIEMKFPEILDTSCNLK